MMFRSFCQSHLIMAEFDLAKEERVGNHDVGAGDEQVTEGFEEMIGDVAG